MPGQMSLAWYVTKVKEVFKSLPDQRKSSPNLNYSIQDGALSGFALFFMQSESFLEHQRAMEQVSGKNNAKSMFGIGKIPSDNQTRNILDTIRPELLYPVFAETFDHLEQSGYLKNFCVLGDKLLVALDGTEYFRSSKINCNQCSTITHANGKVSHSHKVLMASVVSPNSRDVISLDPEFIIPQDGSEKQDCEINAAKRWVDRHAHLAEKGCIFLGDDLFSRNPFCRQVKALGFDFIFVCKPESHKSLYELIFYLEQTNELATFTRRSWNGRFHERYEYRFYNNVHINGDENAMAVNWVEITIYNTSDKSILYKNSFVTTIEITAANVEQIVFAGRARWKIENGTNNVLKTKGYHLEHNYGHGKNFLSMTLLTINLLAFLAHIFLEFVDVHYQSIRKNRPSRKRFFQDLSALTTYLFFDSWDQLMSFMIERLEIKLPLNSG